jgi:hypothetical protein
MDFPKKERNESGEKSLSITYTCPGIKFPQQHAKTSLFMQTAKGEIACDVNKNQSL